MSSKAWYDRMKAAFPQWKVYDSSGNNFYMVRNLTTVDGTPIMVGIAENVSYFLKHKDSERFATFGEWDVQNDADDVAGAERAYDAPELFQPLYLADERDGELYEAQGGAARMLNEETKKYIQDVMVEFMAQYMKG